MATPEPPGPGDEERAPGRRGKLLRRLAAARGRILQLLIVGALMVLALLQIDLGAFADAFRHAQYGWVIVALAVYTVSRLVHALEWQVTLQKVGHVSLGGLFGVLLIGTLVNAVVPASAGDVVKVQLVANRYGLSRAGLIATRGAEAIVNGLLIVFFIVLSFVLPGARYASRTAATVMSVVVVAILAAAVFGARLLPPEAPRSGLFPRLPRRLRDGIERQWPQMRRGLEMIRSPRLLGLAIAFNIVGWVFDIAISWCFGLAFDLKVPLAAYVAATVAIALVTIFPITFGNVGTFETAVVGALTLNGVPAHEALAYALATHLFSSVFNIVLGVAAMLVMRVGVRELFSVRNRAVAAAATPAATTAATTDK